MGSETDFVDTHFHVWELGRFDYPWPTKDMKIYRDYFPCALEKASGTTPVRHGVFVQCLHKKEEADWVIDMASRHPFIKGVVAGLDLTSPELEETIISLKPSGLLKGVRHILDMEEDDWITKDDVSRGLDLLAKHNLTYDLLVRPRHLKYVPEVLSKHPNLKFVINHIAKPPFHTGAMDGWQEDMAAIAKFQNVHCKLSGLISEQERDTWRSINFQPYIQHVLAVFTADRCMFGSDWPVFDMVGASYEENFNVVANLLSNLPEVDRRKIFRSNAIQFYNLQI